jgi:hypothetical protein
MNRNLKMAGLVLFYMVGVSLIDAFVLGFKTECSHIVSGAHDAIVVGIGALAYKFITGK